MDIEYYERSVLTTVQPARQDRVMLNDLHKRAWWLFAEHANVERPRPFTFRFDPAGSRFLLTLRADRPFKGATPHLVTFNEGEPLAIDLALTPLKRRKRVQHCDPCEYVPEQAQWAAFARRVAQSAGLTLTAEPVLEVMGRYKVRQAMYHARPVVNARIEATVGSVPDAAQAWLDGIGRSKAFGLGMPRLALDSPLQAQRAA